MTASSVSFHALPEDPPGFIVATEAQKAAFAHGFRLERGVDGPWLRYASTTVPGEVWLAGCPPTGPWWLAVSHPGVAAELGHVATMPGSGAARFYYATLQVLYVALDRAYRLAQSLPTVPLTTFQQQVIGLPRTTEAERLTVQRIGQGVFRQALLDYWGARCPLTGIADLAMLRASHIVPWAACRDDAHRLDVHNGLLLSALWDAAFDAGLVSFGDDGTPLLALSLSAAAVAALALSAPSGILTDLPALTGLLPAHLVNLQNHRTRHSFSDDCGAELTPKGMRGPVNGISRTPLEPTAHD